MNRFSHQKTRRTTPRQTTPIPKPQKPQLMARLKYKLPAEIKSMRAFKLSYTLTELPELPNLPFINSGQVVEILQRLHNTVGNNIQEHFYVLFLDRANKPFGYV